ncbi:MAG: chemotaxis protein CheW [Cyanobacteria bacterium J06626_18]
MSEASSSYQSALSFPVEEGQDVTLLPASDIAAAKAGEQYLRLRLGTDVTALLPLQQLGEVLTIPLSQIIPMPHMPSWVMGIYNWRGEILWMVDLGHLCGFTPWHQQALSSQTHTAVILSIENYAENLSHRVKQTIGLVVNQVEDIEQCLPDMIYPSQTSRPIPELEPFLRGYWWTSNGDMLAVLDGSAILEKMPKSEQ